MKFLSVLAAAGLVVSATSVSAQPTNAELEQRIDRLERQLDRIERQLERRTERPSSRPSSSRPSSPRQEVVAATNESCIGNCGAAAQRYCQRTGFRTGVSLRNEMRGPFEYVVQARCFN